MSEVILCESVSPDTVCGLGSIVDRYFISDNHSKKTIAYVGRSLNETLVQCPMPISMNQLKSVVDLIESSK